MGFDTPTVQAWLEDRAAQGLFLDRYGWLCDFTPGEPKAVRYRLEPLARGRRPRTGTGGAVCGPGLAVRLHREKKLAHLAL